MTFRVTLPDDPDLPLKEEDKHQTEKILEAPVKITGGVIYDDTKEDGAIAKITFEEGGEVLIEELAEMAGTALENMETIFNDAIPQLISIVEEVNPPEKAKVIGKLRGALELFNQK